MVEMAIIVPLLLMLVFGIIEFGRAYNANVSVTHAAREGVREYAVTQDASLGTAAAINAATSLNPAAMTVTLSACNKGDPATMHITYPFQLNIPFVPLGAIQLSAEGVMRCGG
jgi:Flp pilus assembly protein TadG